MTAARHALAALAAAALLAAAPALAEPRAYALDPEHMGIGFLVDHVGYAKVLGMFRDASGSFTFDEQTGALSDLKIEIDTASIFTNHRKRDDHLRSPDFLNTAEFPKMTFTAAGARKTGERTFVIDGRLTLLGRTQPVTLTATWNKSGEYPFGDKHYAMGISARGSFKRSAFGMMYAVENRWVGDEVELIIELEAKRK